MEFVRLIFFAERRVKYDFLKQMFFSFRINTFYWYMGRDAFQVNASFKVKDEIYVVRFRGQVMKDFQERFFGSTAIQGIV